jgi:hypothetical protein
MVKDFGMNKYFLEWDLNKYEKFLFKKLLKFVKLWFLIF